VVSTLAVEAPFGPMPGTADFSTGSMGLRPAGTAINLTIAVQHQ
jgi:hypothetical protein